MVEMLFYSHQVTKILGYTFRNELQDVTKLTKMDILTQTYCKNEIHVNRNDKLKLISFNS